MGTPMYVVNFTFNKHFLLLSVLFITHDIWTNTGVQVTLQIKLYEYLFILCSVY